MNYFAARQLADHTGWRYTCRNDDDIWAAAGCSDLDHVHPTADEAEACAADWVVANARFDIVVSTASGIARCRIDGCDALIAEDEPNAAQFGVGMPTIRPLCPVHLNADGVRLLVGDRLGRVVSS